MYRKSTAEIEATDWTFVNHLYDLPVVNSAVGKLGDLYTGTKEHNRLFRFTLQTAESGLGLMVNTAKPVVAKFEKPIGTLNGLACHQLEKLEHDYPIITKPTDVVVKQTLEACQSAVRPITDRVGSITNYGATKINDARVYTVDTIGGVKSYGVNKVNDVKSYGVDKVNDVKSYSMDKLTAVTDLGGRQVTRMLEHQTGRAVIAKVNLVIELADFYVDRYLPEEEDHSEKNSCLRDAPREVDDAASDHRVVLTKACQLGSKVRRRGYKRVARKLKLIRMHSSEAVDKLHFNVDLIACARSSLDGVRGKVYYIWEEINKTPENLSEDIAVSEHSLKNLTYERRAIGTARHVTYKLKTGLSRCNIESLPEPVREQIYRAMAIIQALYQRLVERLRGGEGDAANANSVRELVTSLASVSKTIPSTVFTPTVKKFLPHTMVTGALNDSQAGEQEGLNDTSAAKLTNDDHQRQSEQQDETEHRYDENKHDHDENEFTRDEDEHISDENEQNSDDDEHNSDGDEQHHDRDSADDVD